MSLSPQKLREMVFQLLYGYDFFPEEEEECIDFLMEKLAVTAKSAYIARDKRRAVSSHIEEIDECIKKFASEYSPERIGRVEKNILRLGVYELLYDQSIPGKVAIAEAVRLARKFATPESGAFINAVLDALFRQKTESCSEVAHESTPVCIS